ncbi:MAG: multidrug transporter [Flavobacteriales bacterium]|nr:multidrug transporter [Flavobacteriales bacterium]
MHSGKHFAFPLVLRWTRREIVVFLLIAAIPTFAYKALGLTWLMLPWLPIALLGTAVAFLVGFKNNATYSRLWEARTIWGSIINNSRTWGFMTHDLVGTPKGMDPASDAELPIIRRRLIMRHLAWVTALRYQLRQPRVWEDRDKPINLEMRRTLQVAEQANDLQAQLEKYLDPREVADVMQAANATTQLLARQSVELRLLKEQGRLDHYSHVNLAKVLADLVRDQGSSERIKNFPYPRQLASMNHYFVWLFIVLLPFGMVHEFAEIRRGFVWLTIPFGALIGWVFHTMDRVGEINENPFSGGANDVPITAIARIIEVDLLQVLGEKEVPELLKPVNEILM